MAGLVTIVAREMAIAGPGQAEALGLPAAEWGVLFAESKETGERWTLVGDPDYARMFRAVAPEVLRGLEIPTEKFPLKRRGWQEPASSAASPRP
ncbi:MAG: hypothetical protein QM729_07070 [Solirubrobacterales bacterium]